MLFERSRDAETVKGASQCGSLSASISPGPHAVKPAQKMKSPSGASICVRSGR
jgi:hypothetical protein